MTLGVLNAFRFRLNTLAIVLIPVCIAINWAGHALAKALNLLFLDSVGTVLGGLLAGPWVGGISGLLTNILSSGSTDPIAWAYCGVAFAIGIAAGIGGYYGWQNTWPGRIALYVLIVLVASIISTPINIGLYQGGSGVPFGDALYAGMVKSGWPTWLAAYIDEASGDIPDKLITVVVATAVFFGLPKRYRSLFSVWRRSPGEPEPAPAS
jgi:energy-coupling factor transport system substrate-specific component